MTAKAACTRRPQYLTVVIKLGTSSIVDEKTHEPLLPILALIVDTAVRLRKNGHRVVIVSSGAVALGLTRMDGDRRPKHLAQLQALAAIGQCRLVSLWDSLFSHLDQPVAQILLTRGDIADRTRYINAQNTLNELLHLGVIPIVNENDTLAVSEIKFGDNDTLSAITAAMIHADLLFLMTDVDCLYDKNPRHSPGARAIEVIHDIDLLDADVSSAGSALGTGGMTTKLIAAELGTSAGVTTIITRSSNPDNILAIINYLYSSTRAAIIEGPDYADPLLSHTTTTTTGTTTTTLNLKAQSSRARQDGPPLHTRFLPSSDPIRDRDFWLLHTPSPHGTVYIDAGAHRALLGGAGLLPAGVVGVEGSFASHAPVRIMTVNRRKTPATVDGKMWDGAPDEIGRALANYASKEIFRIMGRHSVEIGELLGYADSEYIAHRSHIALIRNHSRSVSPILTTA